MPTTKGDLIICCVERGVRNHNDVVMVWGRWGNGLAALNFDRSTPITDPKINARRGPLAADGVIGFKFKGGTMIQLISAPHTMAAKDKIAVGRVNIRLLLWRVSSGGCWFIPSCLITVPRAV